MWSKVGMGGEHHRYYKYAKLHRNPRVDPKFLVHGMTLVQFEQA